MGWQDREYNRGYRGGGGGLMWLVTGRLPLFRAFGIDVRAHASLVLTIGLGLVFGLGLGFSWRDRLEKHDGPVPDRAHARVRPLLRRPVGGRAGRRDRDAPARRAGAVRPAAPAAADVPHRRRRAGRQRAHLPRLRRRPARHRGFVPWNPFAYYPLRVGGTAGPVVTNLVIYSYWVYQMSWSLLVFNLLPIWPLDGGQMAQAALWPRMGFFRSMKLSTEIGMVAAGVGGAFALSTGNVGLAILAGLGFYTCYVMRQQLMANGPEDFEGVSYAVGPDPVVRRPKQSWRAERRLRAEKKAIETEAADVDRILEKVARSGMHSLSNGETQNAPTGQRKPAETRRRQGQAVLGNPPDFTADKARRGGTVSL